MTSAPATKPDNAEATALQAQMKDALRRLGKAVVVITSRHERVRYAMAATAVSELSLDPPSMLICVNRTSSLYAPLSAGADFCINILDAGQRDIAAACSGARKGEDRFAVGTWRDSEKLHLPMIADAQASFVCVNRHSGDYGTHGVFLGEVVEAHANDTVDPLIYVDGRYAAISKAAAGAARG